VDVVATRIGCYRRRMTDAPNPARALLIAAAFFLCLLFTSIGRSETLNKPHVLAC
jgi:hypothetical protein